MALRIKIQYKLVNLDNYSWRLFDVTSSQHVLNGYDTTGNVNETLEMCKCMPSMVPPAIVF